MSEIASGVFRPIYFLEGEESYFIDKVADALELKVLTETEKAFNFQIFYARETDLLDVLTAARRFPMMANHQLILVREAQQFKDLDLLLNYTMQPVPSTVLVFLYKGKTVSKATKLGKELQKHALLTTKALYDSEMNTWLAGHLKAMKLSIEPKAAELLLRTCGNNLTKLSGELDKIHANLGHRSKIDLDDIARHTGIDKEYNIFEFTRGLGERNRIKCLQIIKYFNANPKDNPFVVILFNLYAYFKKVHLVHYAQSNDRGNLAGALGINPYYVPEYLTAAKNFPPSEIPRVFDLMHEYDLKSKGYNSGHYSDSELLTELVIRILR